MGTTDGKTTELIIPNRESFERMAMVDCAGFAAEFGFSKERIEDVKTAVSEACMNAFEHGNRSRPDAEVIIRTSFEDNRMVVLVIDEGEGIAKMPPEPSIERKIEGKEPARGFGLFLIRHLADGVSFEKTGDGRHAVRMVFEKKT